MKRLLFGKKKKKHQMRLASVDEADQVAYQYAMQEYNQTVGPPTHQTMTGGGVPYSDSGDHSSYEPPPLAESGPRRHTPDLTESSSLPTEADMQAAASAGSTTFDNLSQASSRVSSRLPEQQQYEPPQPQEIPSRNKGGAFQKVQPVRRRYAEPEMPDATYEEHYGDAYVGAPIKYIYPSGYQSMRPRGGPWKLSIAIFVVFTWLSIFIVGHCSDRHSNSQYYNYNGGNYDDDQMDDALVYETRWCGSRMLYFMWVVSMLITGLAAAYCSVIGYIKVRDFVVANSRSQPPGMSTMSDYYVKIDDSSSAGGGRPPSPSQSMTSYASYQKSIYQSDGTPQFWGGHIYRPTQAAVAVTSR